MGKRLIKLEVKKSMELGTKISVLNGVLNMTSREMDVITAFIEHDPKLAGTTESRAYVLENTEVKSRAVLNNLIKSIKDKGILIPIPKTQTYKFHPILEGINEVSEIEILINV